MKMKSQQQFCWFNVHRKVLEAELLFCRLDERAAALGSVVASPHQLSSIFLLADEVFSLWPLCVENRVEAAGTQDVITLNHRHVAVVIRSTAGTS